MKPVKKPLMAVAAAALILVVLACNVTSAPTQEPALPASASDTPSIPTPTLTIGPTVTTECIFDSFLQEDITVEDGAEFPPNTAFTKTWKVQNTGSCAWESGSQLVFVSGDTLNGPGSVELPSVAAGASTEISVNFTSPGSAGNYKSYWQMRRLGGSQFGALLFVEIVVPKAEWDLYRIGDTGPVVFAIQYLLRAESYSLTADGIFGPVTRTAVLDFQTAHGLASDGIVGPNTWQALITGHEVANGSHGEDVRAVQYLLTNIYGYGLAVDGIFGPATRTAVLDFQTAHGLASDGIVGPKTWHALVTSP